MAHVASWKTERVAELSQAIMKNPVVGVVDIHGIPGKQFSKMRAIMRGDVELIVAKRSLINLALDEVAKERPGMEALKEAVKGQVGLVVTKENPFKLYKLMEATKTRAPARGGETAPEDIAIKAGDTSFKPGPIVREFTKVGIPAAIERGKVVIKKDALLVRAGDPIPKDLASVLPRLDILPIMLGLDLRAAFEDGVVYQPNILQVDVGALLGQMASGAAAAFNLAVNAGYLNSVTIRPMLTRGHAYAYNLAVQAGIMTPETVQPILVRAHAHAIALASRAPDALSEAARAAIAGAAVAATTPAAEAPEEGEGKAAPDKEKKERKDKEEKKVSAEDAAAGLSGLFG